MKNRKMILILVILLVVGFAAVSRTLVINGIIGITNKKSDFKIIFTNALLNGETRKDFIDNTTKQIINYETNKLTTLNETAVLEYEVANTSRLYDADVRISCITNNEEYVSLEYLPINMTVHAGETKTGKITTKLIKVSTEDKTINVTCTLNTNAVERESLGDEYVGPTYNITFDSEGGEEVETSKTINYGKTYGELPVPVRANHQFLGWYTKSGVKIEKDTKADIIEDQTLYAHWKIDTYNVTIESNDKGTISKTSTIINYGGIDTFEVMPNEGNYLESISCTNGYTTTGYTTETSSTGVQTVTINNNNQESDSVCTVNFALVCPYSIGDSWDYTYNGGVQTFESQCPGVYKLEVWGAQGGFYGGAGGYSAGYKNLSKNDNLYIAVGGQGGSYASTHTWHAGGYNGGGSCFAYNHGRSSPIYEGTGGGATHIALNSNRGELKNYVNNKNEILIVAGGGGGSSNLENTGTPGTGGGLNGGTNSGGYSDGNIVTGGTQTAGGSGGGGTGTFGQGSGSAGASGNGGCGAGGGWYGGGGGHWRHYAGGGGSGYIGGVPTLNYNGTNYAPSTSNGSNTGHGRAKITYVAASLE